VPNRSQSVRLGMTLWDGFCATRPQGCRHLAIIDDARRATFAEIAENSSKVAQLLVRRGFRRGDKAALVVHNSAGYVEGLLGISAAGGIAVPVDVRLQAREIKVILALCEPRVLIADEATLPNLTMGGAGEPWASPITTEPPNLYMIVNEEGAQLGPTSNLPDDTAMVFFTSGTRATPKAVRHTNRSSIASVLALQRLHGRYFSSLDNLRRGVPFLVRYRSRALKAAGRQTWCTPLAFSSISGHECLMGALFGGHTLVTSGEFKPRRLLRMLKAESVNIFAATPTIMELMLRARESYDVTLPSLLVVGIGGEPASPSLVHQIEEAFGCAVVVGYGATELGGGALVSSILEPPGRPRVELLAFPGVRARVIDDHGSEVGLHEIGELVIESPGLMEGYFDRERMTDLKRDAWYATGDIAENIGDGRFRVLGRRDEMILRAGNNVSAAEVETVIGELDWVQEVGVVGVKGQLSATDLIAVVVPVSPEHASAEHVILHCQQEVASYKVPNRVFFTSGLPRTPDGKLRRAVIADMLESGSRRSALGDLQEQT
jgi:acyl-CoA synthetase (AMP-forming)/AMP-acid ligase II